MDQRTDSAIGQGDKEWDKAMLRSPLAWLPYMISTERLNYRLVQVGIQITV